MRLLSWFSLSLALFGQPVTQQAPPATSAPQSSYKPQAKAPATPKELAHLLLDSAFGAAGSASADVQPFVLWRIADCYALFDPKKTLDILDQAFSDAAVLGRDSAGLQSEVAGSTSDLDLERAAEMVQVIQVPKDTGNDPRAYAIQQIVGQLIAHNKTDRAIEFLTLFGGNGPFPYSAAGTVLDALQSPDDARRLLVFGAALSAYQLHPSREFGQLLARQWTKVPKPEAVRAVDAVLEAVSNYKDEDTKFNITYIAQKGSATFNTDRDVQLFDILEPLQALEPGKAKKLLETRPALKMASQILPDGLSGGNSFLGMTMDFRNSASAPPRTLAPDASGAAAFSAAVAAEQQAVDAASRNLDVGSELAGRISNPAFRGSAFRRIAAPLLETAPAVARNLLRKAIAALGSATGADLDPASQNVAQIFDAARKLKDGPLAREALETELDQAAGLFKIDSDPDDPNIVIMDRWPSLRAYRTAMHMAVELDGMNAPAALEQIRNPDAILFSQVALAAALLGREQSQTTGVGHKAK